MFLIVIGKHFKRVSQAINKVINTPYFNTSNTCVSANKCRSKAVYLHILF